MLTIGIQRDNPLITVFNGPAKTGLQSGPLASINMVGQQGNRAGAGHQGSIVARSVINHDRRESLLTDFIQNGPESQFSIIRGYQYTEGHKSTSSLKGMLVPLEASCLISGVTSLRVPYAAKRFKKESRNRGPSGSTSRG